MKLLDYKNVNFFYIVGFILTFILTFKTFFVIGDDYWNLLTFTDKYPVVNISPWIPGRINDLYVAQLILKFLFNINTILDISFFDYFSFIQTFLFSFVACLSSLLSVKIISKILNITENQKKFYFFFYLVIFFGIVKFSGYNKIFAYGFNYIVVLFFLYNIFKHLKFKNNKFFFQTINHSQLFLYLIFAYFSAFSIEYLVGFAIIFIFTIYLYILVENKNLKIFNSQFSIIIFIFLILSVLHFYVSINSGRAEGHNINLDFLGGNWRVHFFRQLTYFGMDKEMIIFFLTPIIIALTKNISSLKKKINKQFFILLFLYLTVFFFYNVLFLSILRYHEYNSVMPLKFLFFLFYVYCCHECMKINIYSKFYVIIILFLFSTHFTNIIQSQIFLKKDKHKLIRAHYDLLVNACKSNQSVIKTNTEIVNLYWSNYRNIGSEELPTKYSPDYFGPRVKETVEKFYQCKFDKPPLFIN